MIYERGTPLGQVAKQEFYLAQCEKKAALWDKVRSTLKQIVKKSKRVNGTHSTVPTNLINKLSKQLGETNE